jgi:UDP-glucuronate decarboxylase
VVTQFITQALHGEPLTIYGEGDHTRSFCYVKDTIRALILMMGHEGPLFGPINIGSQVEVSILEFAKTILNLTNSASSLSFLPLPQDDPRVRCPDIAKAKKLLKWEPKVSLKDGLQKTIEWFKDN